jgi:hypothetical protein
MRAYGVVETEALSEAWKLLLEEARRGWANGEGEPDDILHAAGLLDSLGEYHGTVAEALERRLLGDLTDPAEWEYCADLHEIAPDAFSRERWEALCERLQSLLDDPLCAWSPGSRDDVEERVLKGVSEWHTLNPAGSGRSTRRSLNPPSIAPPPVPQPQPGEDEMIEQVFRRLARLDLESAA